MNLTKTLYDNYNIKYNCHLSEHPQYMYIFKLWIEVNVTILQHWVKVLQMLYK